MELQISLVWKSTESRLFHMQTTNSWRGQIYNRFLLANNDGKKMLSIPGTFHLSIAVDFFYSSISCGK
jgi:hypothetical protein